MTKHATPQVDRTWRAARRVARTLVLLAFVVATMGASCAPRSRSSLSFGGPPAPVVLTATSTAEEIVAAINANTARVTTYQASQASFSSPGLPGLPLLSGSVAVERPRRFRLRATTMLTGPEVDLGSSDQRFWFWARRNEPAGVYTASYQDLASPGVPPLPLDPTLVIDALGLTNIAPASSVQGPFPRGDGQVEIQVTEATPTGQRRRVIVVDRSTAWPIEQHVYDTRETLIASVEAERFEFDPATGVSLPRKVTLRMPEAGMSLRIDTGPLVLNAPIAGGSQLWTMPQIAGTPVIDLTRSAFTTPVAAPQVGAANVTPTVTPFAPEVAGQTNTAAAWTPSPTTAPQSPTVAGLPSGGVALPPIR